MNRIYRFMMLKVIVLFACCIGCYGMSSPGIGVTVVQANGAWTTRPSLPFSCTSLQIRPTLSTKESSSIPGPVLSIHESTTEETYTSQETPTETTTDMHARSTSRITSDPTTEAINETTTTELHHTTVATTTAGSTKATTIVGTTEPTNREDTTVPATSEATTVLTTTDATTVATTTKFTTVPTTTEATTVPTTSEATIVPTTSEATTVSTTTEATTVATTTEVTTVPTTTEATTVPTTSEATTVPITTEATTVPATTEVTTVPTTTIGETTKAAADRPCQHSKSPYCYELFYDKKTYADAYKSCLQLGAGSYLVSMLDDEEANDVKLLIVEESSQPTKDYWMGLGRTRYSWEDGKRLLYHNFASNYNNGICTVMNSADYKWKSKDCSSSERIVCESDKGSQSCSVEFDGSCYELMATPSTLSTAKTLCGDSGGHVLQIETTEEQDFVQAQFAIGEDIWIGLKSDGANGYSWAEGGSLGYDYFGSEHEKNFGVCFRIEYDDGFHWNDDKCDTLNNYICKWTI